MDALDSIPECEVIRAILQVTLPFHHPTRRRPRTGARTSTTRSSTSRSSTSSPSPSRPRLGRSPQMRDFLDRQSGVRGRDSHHCLHRPGMESTSPPSRGGGAVAHEIEEQRDDQRRAEMFHHLPETAVPWGPARPASPVLGGAGAGRGRLPTQRGARRSIRSGMGSGPAGGRDGAPGPQASCHRRQVDEDAGRLRHLLATRFTIPVVQPIPDKGGASRPLALGGLVVRREMRMVPPPWMSKSSPRSLAAIAEHSMCRPGRPGPW